MSAGVGWVVIGALLVIFGLLVYVHWRLERILRR
jgi:hypothetical protein